MEGGGISPSSLRSLGEEMDGGCGKECNTVLKKLATMISEKTGNTQSEQHPHRD